jgi:hypothetical protein
MPKKFTVANLEGGPGASHENKKMPEKSKPHGELKTLDPKQTNTKMNCTEQEWEGRSSLALIPLTRSKAGLSG